MVHCQLYLPNATFSTEITKKYRLQKVLKHTVYILFRTLNLNVKSKTKCALDIKSVKFLFFASCPIMALVIVAPLIVPFIVALLLVALHVGY